MSFYSKRVLLILCFVFVVTLACNLPLIQRANLDDTPIPVSSEAVDELEENVEKAAATAVSDGSINLVISEEQLTSLAVLELQSMSEGQMVRDLQIGLREGQIHVTGDVTNGGMTFPFLAVISVTADGNGSLRSEIVSARVGPFPLPQNIIAQMTTQINQIILQQINTGGNNILIDEIVIADGYMTVNGHLR